MNAFVYFNVRRRDFSLRDLATGRVARRSRVVVLRDVTFKVSEPSRQRVLDTGVKNVHAGAVGRTAARLRKGEAIGLVPVRYCPTESGDFRRLDTGEPVKTTSLLVMAVATISTQGRPDKIVPVLMAKL